MDSYGEALKEIESVASDFVYQVPAMLGIVRICRQALQTDPGYVRVPVEPTVEMVERGAREVDWYEHNARHCYEAMLTTAPAPAEQNRTALEQAHMAGQADAGIDPSYSSARAYADMVVPAPAYDGDEYADFAVQEGHQLCGDLLDGMIAHATAPAERNNIGASFSKMPPYEYQRQASSGDERIAGTIAPAPADSELARLRSALDKIQAIADGYVSEGELPVMVVVQTICKQALLKGADQ